MNKFIEQLKIYKEYDYCSNDDNIVQNYLIAESKDQLNDIIERYNLYRLICSSSDLHTFHKLNSFTFEILVQNGSYTEGSVWKSASQVIETSLANKINVNCIGHSLVLCNILLALGYKARIVFCKGIDCSTYGDHVVVEAFCRDYNKWMMIDPSYALYITDEKSIPCSVYDLRQRIIEDKPINIVSCNRFIKKSDTDSEIFQFTQSYVERMCRILVILEWQNYNGEMDDTIRKNLEFYRLIPVNYLPALLTQRDDSERVVRYTNNPALFYNVEG